MVEKMQRESNDGMLENMKNMSDNERISVYADEIKQLHKKLDEKNKKLKMFERNQSKTNREKDKIELSERDQKGSLIELNNHLKQAHNKVNELRKENEMYRKMLGNYNSH